MQLIHILPYYLPIFDDVFYQDLGINVKHKKALPFLEGQITREHMANSQDKEASYSKSNKPYKTL